MTITGSSPPGSVSDRSRTAANRRLRHPDRLGLHLRVVLSGGVVIGPGRADLLEFIRERGSIAAAGRAMAMSYKRAWGLVEEMHQAFGAALVEAAPGGAAGGGARLTRLGVEVLESYRRLQALADAAARSEIERLDRMIGSGPGRPT